jgi:hypothetical protein
MTVSHEVVIVRGPLVGQSRVGSISTRLGHVAWVNTGDLTPTRVGVHWNRSHRARSRATARGHDWSGTPLARSVTDWLVWVIDQLGSSH